MSRNSSDPKYAWLDDAIAEDAPGCTQIVTASRRLSRQLADAWGERQIAAGKSAWLTPAIDSWPDWLASLAAAGTDAAATPRQLDAFSATLLWERCLRRQMPEGLLSFGGIVRQATSAWQRLHDWDVPLTELAATARHQDERFFAAAAADYQQRLRDEAWIDSAELAGHAVKLITSGATAAPERLVVAGFDRLSPAAKQVLDALAAAGCSVKRVPAPQRAEYVCSVPFERMEAELRAAGAWARELLHEQPDARVAIVCPELDTDAAGIAGLVREGLAPGWQYGGVHHRAAVNVSYGRRLAAYPAIAVALKLLRWVCHGLTSRELSILLRSRSLAADAVSGQSRLELKLRRHPDREWRAENLLQVLAGGDNSPDALAFLECARGVAELAGIAEEKSNPADCVQQIDAFLRRVHWPGDAPLDSAEFQLINRWRELLNELARIDAVFPQLRLSEAITYLNMLAAETLWQPETEPGMVQVLGTLEAAGMEFDGIWVSGLDATQWPHAAGPAPFISHALQRKYAMPDATPGDTLEFSKGVLARLIGAADQCVLSWSQMRGDAELTASTLLDDIETTAYSGPVDPGWYAAELTGNHAPAAAAAFDEAPPVTEEERIGGGAYTVQRQFTEPFAAFVHGRLGVRPPELITIGLAPSVRGNIIHNSLHNLLAGRPSRDEIIKWNRQQRDQRIGSAIDAALAEHMLHADAVTGRIIGLERGRLMKLLHGFLDADMMRNDFSVADVEKTIDYNAFGIRLGLRLDRVDRLADGRLLVIDYKTGQPKHFLNRDGGLTDVQLVVYADALDDDIGGLVLINVDTREISYKAAGAGWHESEQETWPETLAAWRAEVHAVLRTLAAGDVRVNLMQTSGEGRPLGILSRLEEQKRAD